MSGTSRRLDVAADLPPCIYVSEDNAQRCRVSMTVRELDGESGNARETWVSHGWGELYEGFFHFIDDQNEGWQSFPQLAVNWIEWEVS